MRGRSSNAKARLRSSGYKCNLCGRRLIDRGTLDRHMRTIHGNVSRANRIDFRVKPPAQGNKFKLKSKEKVLENLAKQEIRAKAVPKIKIKNNNEEKIRRKIVTNPSDRLNKSVIAAKKARDKRVGNETDKTLGKIKSETVKDKLSNNVGKKVLSVSSSKQLKAVNNPKNGGVVQNECGKNTKIGKRQVEFECPVCLKSFNAYLTAHKHIQKCHSVNDSDENVTRNSPDIVQPIRKERCLKCNNMIRSIERHFCLDDNVGIVTQYVCLECRQGLISTKSFVLHAAALHSEGVHSLFFPTRIEYANWRLEMEREMNIDYALLGEYDTKEVYCCSYPRDHQNEDISTWHLCPSNVVVQDLSKGTQVHFYNKHGHTAREYVLPSKYRKYCISSILKDVDDVMGFETLTNGKTNEERDLYPHFKKLMSNIIINARHLDKAKLKTLIDNALDMTKAMTRKMEMVETVSSKLTRKITDKEITDELQLKGTTKHRRASADSINQNKPSPAKRARNQSVNADSENSSPKILNTFSLASSNNTDNSENTQDAVVEEEKSNAESSSPDAFEILNKDLSSVIENQSFNDSYKDFIDQARTALTKSRHRGRRHRNLRTNAVVKNKMGMFKSVSPESEFDIRDTVTEENIVKENLQTDDANTTQIIYNFKEHITEDSHKASDYELLTSTDETNESANTIKTSKPTSNSIESVAVSNETDSASNSTSTTNATTKFIPKVTGATSKVVNASKLTETSKVSSPASNSSKGTPKFGLNESNISSISTPMARKIKTDFKYEVVEQENDCNILVLKI